MATMEKMAELLFENKTMIPEGLYIKLMDMCKVVNDTPSGLYKLEYYIISTFIKDNKNVCMNIEEENNYCLQKFTKIIDLSTINEPCLTEAIKKQPFDIFYVVGKYTSLFPELQSNIRLIRSYHTLKINSESSGDSSDEELDLNDPDVRKIRVTNSFTCFKYALVISSRKI